MDGDLEDAGQAFVLTFLLSCIILFIRIMQCNQSVQTGGI